MTATEFAAQHGIRPTEWLFPEGNHPTVVLSRPDGMTFRGTFEWRDPLPPCLCDALVGLATAAADVEVACDEQEWARYSGTGINTVPTLVERYRAARAQAAALRTFLPVGAYETLLWDVTQK